MENQGPELVEYRRARFVTRLPAHYRYSPGHCWIAPQADGSWRIGLTKFATRMLGEVVDYGFSIEPGGQIHAGTSVGWIEGFKAVSDLFSLAEGTFAGANPALADQADLVNQDPYGAGWLYAVQGQPAATCLSVQEYRQFLDQAIDGLLEQTPP